MTAKVPMEKITHLLALKSFKVRPQKSVEQGIAMSQSKNLGRSIYLLWKLHPLSKLATQMRSLA